MPNQIVLTFAGDSRQLEKAGQRAGDVTDKLTDSVTGASDEFKKATETSSSFLDKIGKLGAGVQGMSTAVDDASNALGALNDIQRAGKERAAAQARALADVEQATLDAKQATIDLRQANQDLNQSYQDAAQAENDASQANIDLQQAQLDATQAQKAYNQAVHDHGKNSVEAKQALIDLTQANHDVQQAQLDGQQAAADLSQAQQDGTQANQDARQALLDQRTAQLDLNDANAAAHPPELQKYINDIQMVAPIVQGLIGVQGLVTAAQWAWNAAMDANPIGIVVVAVGALIAIIVVIATKTTWFQTAWKASWGGDQGGGRGGGPLVLRHPVG
jgi:chromosome segregation ATPase